MGHIFQLGTKYSESMQATVLDQDGKSQTLVMGCYGMGVTRLVAAVIEQSHDAYGIIWPRSIAPFQIHLIALNYSRSNSVQTATDALYLKLLDAGFEVLLDDRDERPGVKFADADLLGIPQRITLGERNLKNDQVEYKGRASGEHQLVALASIFDYVA